MTPQNSSPSDDRAKELSWSTTTTSFRRTASITGMYVGMMGGEILGRQRQGMTRVACLAMYGRPPYRLSGCFDRCYIGSYGELALAAAQSVLRSRSKQEAFVREFVKRRWWQRVCRPVSQAALASISSNQRRFRLQAEMLVLAASLAPVLQGSGCRPVRWVRAVAEQNRIEDVMSAVTLIAEAAQYSILVDDLAQHRVETWVKLAESVDSERLHDLVSMLTPAMEKNWGLGRAEALVGYDESTFDEIDRLAALAVYAWLRNCDKFRTAVERTVTLGGRTSELGALVGALAGMGAGPDRIPFEWSTAIKLFPHRKKWFRRLTRRLTDWPHGSDDLLRAPAMPSQYAGQLLKNALTSPGALVAPMVRLPCRLRASAIAMGRGRRPRSRK